MSFGDLDTGTEQFTIPITVDRNEALQFVHSAVFAADGASLATGHVGGIVRLWNLNTRRLRLTLNTNGPDDVIHSLAFTPDGKWLLSGGDDFTLRVWETATGQEVHRLSGMTGPVLDIAVSPAGKTALTGGGATAVVWSLQPAISPNLAAA